MSKFGTAFAAARKKLGAGKTFTFEGKSYSTNLKEEVKGKRPTDAIAAAEKALNKLDNPSGKRPKPRPNSITPTAKAGTLGKAGMSTATDTPITKTTLPRAADGKVSGKSPPAGKTLGSYIGDAARAVVAYGTRKIAVPEKVDPSRRDTSVAARIGSALGSRGVGAQPTKKPGMK